MLDFRADVIVIALGENVPALTTPEAQSSYRASFVNLLKTLGQHAVPSGDFLCAIPSGPSRSATNSWLKRARKPANVFVALKDLDKDAGNLRHPSGNSPTRASRDIRATRVCSMWKAVEKHSCMTNWPEFRGPTGDGHADCSAACPSRGAKPRTSPGRPRFPTTAGRHR